MGSSPRRSSHVIGNGGGGIYSSGDWHDLTLDILCLRRGCPMSIPRLHGEKQSRAPRLCLPWEGFRKKAAKPCLWSSFSKNVPGLCSSIFSNIIDYFSRRRNVYHSLSKEESWAKTQNKVSIMLCVEPWCVVPLIHALPWSMRTRDTMMEQERTRRAYYDWNSEWKRKRKAGRKPGAKELQRVINPGWKEAEAKKVRETMWLWALYGEWECG